METDLQKLSKERKYVSDIGTKATGKTITVAGWLYDSRDLGKIRFVVLRDMTGEIQVTGHKDKTKKGVHAADSAG